MEKCFGHLDNTGFSISNGIYPDKDKRFCIGMLGRIYNASEIREYLNKSGFEVENDSHVELVFKSYLKWGENFIQHLKGSFLILIYDDQKKCLLITRDPFGKYPLYYSHMNNGLYFSSDLKLLLSEYSIPFEVDPKALNYYFALRYVPQDATLVKNVRKQPVATQIKYSTVNDELEEHSYWSFSTSDPYYGDEAELADELENILKNGIRMRYSDSIPAGAFLSGGLDSSLIVAMLRELFPGTLNTFSIAFADSKFDESKYSRIVSEHFGTEHHELVVDSSFSEHFEILGEYFNEPIGDPSAIPTYYLCKLASQYCENVFCGEGADCLFLGMNTHEYTYRYSQVYEKAAPIVRLLGNLGNLIPDDVKWKILFRGFTPEQFFLQRSLLFDSGERKKILSENILRSVEDELTQPEISSLKVLDNYHGSMKGKMSYHNATTEVDNTIGMRILMANSQSLFYSTPFMDRDLVSFVAEKVHPDLRIKNGTRKYLLKKVARRYLPADLPIERKKGFNPPISEWLQKEWCKFTRDQIMDIEDDLVNKDYSEKLLKEHRSGEKDHGKKLFSLLMLGLWQKNKKNV